MKTEEIIAAKKEFFAFAEKIENQNKKLIKQYEKMYDVFSDDMQIRELILENIGNSEKINIAMNDAMLDAQKKFDAELANADKEKEEYKEEKL